MQTWTADQDEALRRGVAALGSNSWKRVSEEYLEGVHSDLECLHRHARMLSGQGT